MKAKTFFTILFILLMSSIWSSAQHRNLPNILIFIADDAGMDFVCYGNNFIKTPHIDRLAAEGMVCNRAFLTTSQCSPSRTSILSGQFAHTIGTEDLHTGLNDKVKLVPWYLKQKGYYSGLLMKQHLGKNGNDQFDYVREGNDNEALHLFRGFLDEASEQPFFAWVAFHDPHRPYGGKRGARPVHSGEQVIVPPYFVDTPETRDEIALYYDEIHRMDQNVGSILGELKKRGLRKNTLVIFLSDNGMPFPRGKATAYDFGIRTPFVMQWEGHITAGTRYDGLVSVIDLAPTLLDVAGIVTPEDMYGQSIRPVFTDQSLPGRDLIFAERNWHDTDEHIRCVRSGRYKLIVNGYPELLFPITGDYSKSPTWRALQKGKKEGTLNRFQTAIFEFPRYQVELYDVQNDPWEVDNLIDLEEFQSIALELNAALQQWEKETDDYPPFRKRRSDFIDRKSGFFFNFGFHRDYENYGYRDE